MSLAVLLSYSDISVLRHYYLLPDALSLVVISPFFYHMHRVPTSPPRLSPARHSQFFFFFFCGFFFSFFLSFFRTFGPFRPPIVIPYFLGVLPFSWRCFTDPANSRPTPLPFPGPRSCVLLFHLVFFYSFATASFCEHFRTISALVSPHCQNIQSFFLDSSFPPHCHHPPAGRT